MTMRWLRQRWNFKGLRLLIAALAIAAVIFAGGFQGATSGSLTKWVVVFTSKNTTGVSPAFQDIGQSSHWLTYCINGSVSSLSVFLEGSHDGITFFPISTAGQQTTGCGIIEAGGYYPSVRANLVAFSGAGSVSAWYSASAAPIAGGGLTQAGKTAAPVTFSPGNLGWFTLTSSTSPATVSIPGDVVYGFYVDNSKNASATFATFNGGSFVFQVPVPAASASTITFPAVGVATIANITVKVSTSATSNVDVTNTVTVLAFKRTQPTIYTSSNLSGTVSGNTVVINP